MSEMYGFLLRPRWLAFHAVVLAAVALMVNLGFWQLRRLDERRAFNDTVTERIERAPVPLEDLLDEPGATPDSLEWRLATASGTYLPDQILVFNRSQGGRAGDNVLTPLQLDDGPVVLVNRGFVPLGLDVPPAPTSPVEVLGRARPSEERRLGELTDAAEGPVTEVRRVDIERLAAQLPGTVAPVYLDLVGSDPAPGQSDPAPVPAPELSEGPHLSYAVQWFIFAGCVAVGWVLAVRRSIATRRRTCGEPANGRVPDGADTSADGSDESEWATGSPHLTAGAARSGDVDHRPPAGGAATTVRPGTGEPSPG